MPEYRRIANLRGEDGLDADEMPGMTYNTPVQMQGDENLDELDPGIYVVAFASRAEELGLPDPLPGLLEVIRTGVTALRNQRWTTRNGVWSRGRSDGETWEDWTAPVKSETIDGIVVSESDTTPLADGQLLFVVDPLEDDYEAEFSRGLGEWTQRWDAAEQDEWELDLGGGVDESPAIVTEREASGSTRSLLTWETPPQLKDCEVLFRGRHAGTYSSTRSAVALRASGAQGEENGIVVGHLIEGGNVVLRAATYRDGSFRTAITYETSIEYELGEWYWVRARLEGRDLQVKIWLDGESEPSGWSASTELLQSEGDLPAGRAGLFTSASGTARWDSLTITPIN